ncbi:MAG: hypothetical protein AB4060_11050 [Crocosphaera sp.]
MTESINSRVKANDGIRLILSTIETFVNLFAQKLVSLMFIGFLSLKICSKIDVNAVADVDLFTKVPLEVSYRLSVTSDQLLILKKLAISLLNF